jgi:hypothetical protein
VKKCIRSEKRTAGSNVNEGKNEGRLAAMNRKKRRESKGKDLKSYEYLFVVMSN